MFTAHKVKNVILLIIILPILAFVNINTVYSEDNKQGKKILINQPDRNIIELLLKNQKDVKCDNMWCSAPFKTGRSYVTGSDGFGYSAIFMIFSVNNKMSSRIVVFSDDKLFNESPVLLDGTAKIYKDYIPIKLRASAQNSESNTYIYNFDIVFIDDQGFGQFIKEICTSDKLEKISFALLDKTLLLQFSLNGFNKLISADTRK